MAEPADIARQLELVASKYAASAYRDGLRPAQWQTLRFFATAASDERNVTGFAAWRGTTNGSTSILVSKLVERGYLSRGDSYTNRNVDLHVTEKARRALRNDPFEDLKAVTEQMSSTQRESVRHALNLVIERLSKG